MRKIIKYVLTDIIRNKIIIAYTVLLLAISFGILSLESSSTKAMLSLLNIVLIIVPLVSIIFSTIYVYNSSEFMELLLGQPLKRKTIWLGTFVGLATSLALAFLIGIGIPVLLFNFNAVGMMLLATGFFLSVIFVSIAMLATVYTRDKAKGIGISIMLWLYFSLLFDSLVLMLLFQFEDYPLENVMIVLSALNPIDLSRILILLKMDVSALMGYTGAIFKNFFGTQWGMLVSFSILLLWIIVPLIFSLRKFRRKDL